MRKLNDVALAQALYNKMVALKGKQFNLDMEIRKHERSAKAVRAEIARHPEIYNATEKGKQITVGDGFISNLYVPYSAPTKANRKKHAELQNWLNWSRLLKKNWP